MKKTLATCVALFAITSVSQIALAEFPTYNAKFAQTPIKVDGVIDDQWKDAVKTPITPTDPVVKASGTVWDEVKAGGDFRVMWDNKYIYWAFSIKDDMLVTDADDVNFWQNDCVSGFLYDEAKEINIKFFTSPREDPYTCTGIVGAGVERNDAVVTGVKIVDGGYNVEVALPWIEIAGVMPKADDAMAFTTLIIDKNDNWGQYMWVGDGDNVDNFASIKLVK